MAASELLIVILNHTNEELNIEPESPSLDHGDWMDTSDSRPPQEILAGESGMLRCKSSHMYGAINGSVSYRVVGFEINNKVTFSWSIPYVGPNKYDCCCPRDAFKIKVLGGRGQQPVVVFVFEPTSGSDAGLDNDVQTRPVKTRTLELPLPPKGFGIFHVPVSVKIDQATIFFTPIETDDSKFMEQGKMIACGRLIQLTMLLALSTVTYCHRVGGEYFPILEQRAAPDAPDGYTPARVPCPKTRPVIREATALSSDETLWLSRRDDATIPALEQFLTRVDIGGIDIQAYLDGIVRNGTALPRIGIAVSGGGYRAMINGAGAIAAFDNRTTGSTDKGHLGGIVQAATYLSGLSGGSWVVGSLYVQNFTTVESIIYGSNSFLDSLWQLDDSIFEGPSDLSRTKYYRELHQDVKGKVEAGYNKSITDYWGRSLSYQLVNASDGGPAYTFSSIANDTEFAAARAPMPIIVAVERTSGQLQIASNSTIVEFNPWEMGSFDPGLGAFAPLKYVGSDFQNGTIGRNGVCVAGVDNAGFVMGTSASLFNQAFLQISKVEGAPDFLIEAINNTLADIGEENRDIANWPNPFYKYNPKNNSNADSTILTLVDGGEDYQNIPFHPLLVSDRHVDVIFAIDGSADTKTRWPNGTALVATYQRSKANVSTQNNEFPKVPDQNTFINLGLNMHPTFFGCDTDSSNSSGPLIVYLPNAPYSYESNFTTFDLEYSNNERNQIVRNGYNVATMGNGTMDSDWPACVGCAVLARSLARTGTDIPPKCAECFQRYCWNGTTNSTVPRTYEPELMISSGVADAVPWLGAIGFTLLVDLLLLYA